MADEYSIVLSIFAFYVGLFVLLGLIGSAFVATDVGNPDAEDASISGVFDAIGFFLNGIGFSISSLPAWANTLLFAPLSIVLFYIVVRAVIELIPL